MNAPGFGHRAGVWAMWPRNEERPERPLTAIGQRAWDAFLVARASLPADVSFCDLEFELVAERVPEPVAAPTQRKPRAKRAEALA